MKASYLYNVALNTLYGSKVRVDKNVLVYCPRCGAYTSAHFAQAHNNACTYCGVEYQHTDELFHDVYQNIAKGLDTLKTDSNAQQSAQLDRAINEYLNDHYFCLEPYFDAEAMAHRLNKHV